MVDLAVNCRIAVKYKRLTEWRLKYKSIVYIIE